MLFNSVVFLFYFLPIFLLIYYILPSKGEWKNLWFILGSIFFYIWKEQSFVLIIFASIIWNYCIGLGIGKSSNSSKKLFLLIGVAFNLILLIYFKYAYFIGSSLDSVLGDNIIDEKTITSLRNIYLPLGISFFTFQSISYLIDVYYDKIKEERNLIHLACYIIMFPQLIAGPIVRYEEIKNSLIKRQLKSESVLYGIKLFVIGLSYKVLIANQLSVPVDAIFKLNQEAITMGMAWLASIAYTFQIYFDFCGYSTMAVGLGLMLGFKLPVNFQFPYTSSSITEFWRRWHITLSSWFRDYLYIPLGGNRKGASRTYVNLLIVFLLCGLWHGAAWTFLLWGIYHGLFLVIERIGFGKVLEKFPKIIQYSYCLVVVLVGWVFFRANDFSQATGFIKKMIGLDKATLASASVFEYLNPIVAIILVAGCIFSTKLINTVFYNGNAKTSSLCAFQSSPERRFALLYDASLVLFFLLSIVFMVNQSFNPFIYFRF